MKVVVFVTFLIIAVAITEAKTTKACTYTSATQSEWVVTYVENSYDANTDYTTFIYSVQVKTGAHGLSHWVLGIPNCGLKFVKAERYTEAGTKVGSVTFGSYAQDPWTSLYGIKSDNAQESGTLLWHLVFQGHVNVGSMDYAVKGATDCYVGVGEVMGPVCGVIENPSGEIVVSPSATCQVYGGGIVIPLAVVGSNFYEVEWYSSLKEGEYFVPDNTVTSPTLNIPAGQYCSVDIVLTAVLKGEATSTTVTATVHISDNDAPELVVNFPNNDDQMECDDMPEPPVASAMDLCCGKIVPEANIYIEGNIYHMEYTATDCCGLQNKVSRSITIVDHTAPEIIGVPESVEVECADATCPEGVIAKDNCDEVDPEVHFTETKIEGSCADMFTVIRTWWAIDSKGNRAEKTQTVVRLDTEEPTLIYDAAQLQDITVQCSEIPAAPLVYAEDKCAGKFQVPVKEERIDGTCIDQFTIIRKWHAEDKCSNFVEVVQTIHVIDTVAPKLDLPTTHLQHSNVETGAAAQPCKPVIIDEHCSRDIIESSTWTIIPGSCPHQYDNVTTYIVEDLCGNMASTQFTISVDDHTPPTLIGTPTKDVTVECDDEIPEYKVTVVDDNDKEIQVQYTETIVEIAKCDRHLIRTWFAEDKCGNSVSRTQTVYIKDDQAPKIIGDLKDLSVSCQYVPPAPTLSAVDNCDGILPTVLTQTRYDGTCENDYVLVRTWTVQDACGNAASLEQSITVYDNKEPNICKCPLDETVECDAIPPVKTVDITDNCDRDVTKVFTETTSEVVCPGQYKLTRTWCGTDNCGLSTCKSQIIYVQDTTAPSWAEEWTTIPNEKYSCTEEFGILEPVAVDACTAVTVTMEEVKEGDSCAMYITRTWTATDECGHSITNSHVITVLDETAPTMDLVPYPEFTYDDTYEACQNDWPMKPTFTYSDDCNEVIATEEYIETTLNEQCPQLKRQVRHWAVSDACGNVGPELFQTIDTRDTTAPVIVEYPLPEVSILCDDDYTPPTVFAIDCNGAPFEATLLDPKVEDGTCLPEKVVTYTWLAADCAGNQITAQQVLLIKDKSTPEWHDLPEAHISRPCTDLPETPEPYVTDTCFDDPRIYPEMNLWQVVSDTCVGTYTRKNTWYIADPCGHQTSFDQVVDIYDDEVPVLIGVPDDYTLECKAPTIEYPTVTATDNCDPAPTVVMTETRYAVGGEECPAVEKVVRTYVAEDDCGLKSTKSYTITIQDTQDPWFDYESADTQVECEEPAVDKHVGLDLCDDEVAVTYTQAVEDGTCAQDKILTRVWVAEDNCGHLAKQTQIITVKDTKNPKLENVPENIDSQPCDVLLPLGIEDVVGTDDCDPEPTLGYTETREDGLCPDDYYIMRTWTVDDHCGHQVTETRYVHYVDLESPSWVGDFNTFVELEWFEGIDPEFAPALAEDNCDAEVIVQCKITKVPNCGDNDYTWDRVCDASDNCGHPINRHDVIHVKDTTIPELIPDPEDIDVECSDIPEPEDVQCPEGFTVVYTQTRQDGTCPDQYKLIRTWSVVDDCNNANSVEQVITVYDNFAPEISDVPDENTFQCDEQVIVPEPSVWDECDGTPEMVRTSTIVDTTLDGCGNRYEHDIYYTWTANDNCGNYAEEHHLIHIVDDTDPFFPSWPADTEPVQPENKPEFYCPPAQDNCDYCPVTTLTTDKIDGTCADQYTYHYTCTATDGSGNAHSEVQVTEIADTAAPVLYMPDGSGLPTNIGPVEYTRLSTDFAPLDANGNPAVADVHCFDSTVGEIILDGDQSPAYFTYLEQIFPGTSPHSYTVQRDWECADRCGNVVAHQQIIKVKETINNVCKGDQEGIYECDNVPTKDAFQSALEAEATKTGETDLGGITIDYTETRIDGSCPNQYQLIRTWVVTDVDGNMCTSHDTLNVQDTTKPVWEDEENLPLPVTISCEEEVEPLVLAATDNCEEDAILVPRSEPVITAIDDRPIEDNYYATYTWVATDSCGNSITHVQVITVEDKKHPEWSEYSLEYPDESKIDCNAEVVDPDMSGDDNCDESPMMTYTKKEEPYCDALSMEATKKIVYHFNLFDHSGNYANELVKTIIVEDTTSPTLLWEGSTQLPENEEVSCDNLPEQEVLTATDDCHYVEVTPGHYTVDGSCPGEYEIHWTWETNDPCGNPASHSKVVYVHDDTAPEFVTIHENHQVECSDLWYYLPDLSATDNCSPMRGTFNAEWTENIEDADCGQNYVRTLTATDLCGNPASYTYSIFVRDTQAPTWITEVEDQEFDCVLPETLSKPEATDNCATDFDYHESTRAGKENCDNDYEVIYSWWVEDSCGHRIDTETTFHAVDITPPTLDEPDCDSTAACDEKLIPDEITATDYCDGEVPVTRTTFIDYDDEACLDEYRLTWVWYAEDSCGNTNTVDRIIDVHDRIAPDFYDEDGFMINYGYTYDVAPCNDVPAALVLHAEDNCDPAPFFTATQEITEGKCDAEYSVKYIYQTHDRCGYSNEYSYVMVVTDPYNPEIEPVAPYSGTCELPVEPVEIIATHPCFEPSELTITGPVVAPHLEYCDFEYTRTWTVTDPCGNHADVTQAVSIYDDTKPTFNEPEPEDINDFECDQELPTYTFSAQDNCQEPTVVRQPDETTEGSCPQQYDVYRSWVAKDNCGNEVKYDQVIHVVDTTAPTLKDLPEDHQEKYCGDESPLPQTWTADDNCDLYVPTENIITTHTYVGGECSGYFDYVYHFAVEDDCGNKADAYRTVHYFDTTPPKIFLFDTEGTKLREWTDEEVDAECNGLPEKPLLWCEDECAPCDVDEDETQPVRTDGTCEDEYTLTYTWAFHDHCGNYVYPKYTVKVSDTVSPTLTVPADSRQSCSSVIEPTVDLATASDNCDPEPDLTLTFITVEDEACASAYKYVNTWTATDRCGHSVSDGNEIVIYDDEEPIFVGLPENKFMQCGEWPATPAKVKDNCFPEYEVWPTETVEQFEDCQGHYTVVRTYHGDDDCGHPITAERRVFYEDTTSPVLVCPETSLDFEVDQLTCAPELTATDNCDNDVPVTFTEEVIDSQCEFTYILKRVWSVVDSCNNPSECVQIVTVHDYTSPTLYSPNGPLPLSYIEVAYDQVPDVEIIYAVDNSGDEIDLNFEEYEIDRISQNEYTIVRHWWGADACGNPVEFWQTIKTFDLVPPKFNHCPADITVECDAVPAASLVFVIGESLSSEVEYKEIEVEGGLLRTWKVHDDAVAQNEVVCQQMITIVDTTAPCLSREPADETVSCDSIPAIATVFAQDNCDEIVKVSFTEDKVNIECDNTYELVRTWVAIDSYGNTAEHTQHVFVQDTKDPEFIDAPESATIECVDYEDAKPLYAVDDCAILSTEANLEYEYELGDCEWNFVETRTYTIADNCNHKITHTQVLTVQDTQGPTFEAVEGCLCPADDTWFVYQPASKIFLVRADLCSESSIEFVHPFVSTTSNGDFQYDPETDTLKLLKAKDVVYTVTAIAVDACGNTTPLEKVIRVEQSAHGCD